MGQLTGDTAMTQSAAHGQTHGRTHSQTGFASPEYKMDLLRFSTAGSVDDGKSTLIGRLLYDSKGVFEDQLAAVSRATKTEDAITTSSGSQVDLAMLTDGLKAEREQGITIDVAYRYFATPRRKFIIADTPGHEQYTRNMATGASTAEASIILVDARKGVQVQSRRHAYIAHLLGIPHLIVAVNKMDLVDFSQEVFEGIRDEFTEFLGQLGRHDLHIIPVSALNGDNVVTRATDTMPWYQGMSLLEHLETIDISGDENLSDMRFPVQLVIRPDLTFRAFAGEIVGGIARPGDPVTVLPSRKESRISRIHTMDAGVGGLDMAYPPMSVAIQLEDEIDISRGDMIVARGDEPGIARVIEATLVWMDEKPLQTGRPYLIKHTTREVRCRFSSVLHRTDVNTLEKVDADGLELNEIGRVQLSCAQPLYFDSYEDNRHTGSFIVIDLQTNNTVAAGMIASDQPDQDSSEPWAACEVDRAARESVNRHKAGVVWITGKPGAGKRELARALELRLFREGIVAYRLDAENLRGNLSRDLSAGLEAEQEHLRRVAEVARILVDAGHVVIANVSSPRASLLSAAREVVGDPDFVEVHIGHPEPAAREPAATGPATAEPAATGGAPSTQAEHRPNLILPLGEIDRAHALEGLFELLADRGIVDVGNSRG